MLGDPEQIVSNNGTHLHQANSANSAITMESIISDQPRIILERMKRLKASSKCSNVLVVPIPIIPRTVLLLPQQANTTQSAEFIVFFKNIVPSPTILPEGHHPNYFSVEQYERHSILSNLRYSSKSQVINFVQFKITIEQFAIGFSTKVKMHLLDRTSVLENGLEDKSYVAQDLYLTTFRLEIKSILVTLLNCCKTVPDIRIFRTVRKNSYWIIIHLRITQIVKTHAYLEPKLKFRSQPQTPCCIANLNDLRQVRQVSRSSRLYRRVSASPHRHASRSSRPAAGDEKFEASRYAQASSEVCRRVQRTRIEEIQVIHSYCTSFS